MEKLTNTYRASLPEQRLVSRRTRSMLPYRQVAMYKPKVQMTVTEQDIHKRKQATTTMTDRPRQQLEARNNS